MDYYEVQTYKTILKKSLPKSIVGLDPPPQWLAFFSPSGVEAVYTDISDEHKTFIDGLKKVAIGPTTAKMLHFDAVASQPTAESLLQAVLSVKTL